MQINYIYIVINIILGAQAFLWNNSVYNESMPMNSACKYIMYDCCFTLRLHACRLYTVMQ